MNKKLDFSQFRLDFYNSPYKILYDRYKVFLIPLIVIIVSFVLTIKILIPQIQDLIAVQNESNRLRERVETLKSNLNLLSGLDQSVLDNQLTVVSSALPVEKDFAGILNALIVASSRSGASLGDFSFQIGELATGSAALGRQLSIQVNLTLSGNVFSAQRFLQELSKTTPLSEVKTGKVSGNSFDVSVNFFYRPIPQLKLDEGKMLTALSKSETDVISEISSWSQPSPFTFVEDIQPQESTPSASNAAGTLDSPVASPSAEQGEAASPSAF